jgi:alpha-glucuronidase
VPGSIEPGVEVPMIRFEAQEHEQRKFPKSMNYFSAARRVASSVSPWSRSYLATFAAAVALSLALFTLTGDALADDAPPGKASAQPALLENEDGYDLWLRYPLVADAQRLLEYRSAVSHLVLSTDPKSESATSAATRAELVRGLRGLLGVDVPAARRVQGSGAVVLGTPQNSQLIAALPLRAQLALLGDEGFLIRSVSIADRPAIVIAANSEMGLLYGAFRFLRQLQTHASLTHLAIHSYPRIENRVLNHWDNLDRSVERGYAGASLWEWEKLPGTLSPRYRDYARANASIGINGTVLTNVNANAQVLTPDYLLKVKALAAVFRPYGIRVFLTARFSAPIEIGGLTTADPLAPEVRRWWKGKAAEIYSVIPDFGGFLVKANSEGQPGPQDYGRSHADGANMLADAVAPFKGIVMWRAFVYSAESPIDRIKQAYEEFQPLDGAFRANVLVQAKNGALDFQPREPFHPLFGAMPRTPVVLELQITKEYLGQDTHLTYLGPWYEEVLKADTYAKGPGSTVARVIDGSLHGYSRTAIAGVANIGSDRNWTGSHFNQANWYVYGRMAWDPDVTSRSAAEDWIRATLSNDRKLVLQVTQMMVDSHQTLVNYMTPLGLAHIMATHHHYGPGPWVSDQQRPEWNPTYYHRADRAGIGFDRTASGSNAVAQYFSPVRERFEDRATVPEDLLLFFHRVGWQEPMRSGRSLWDELVHRYSLGVSGVAAMRATWSELAGRLDQQRFQEIAAFLAIQHDEARWWRDAALSYFQQLSGLPIPSGYTAPAFPLDHYLSLSRTCPPDRDKPRCPQLDVKPN